MNRRTIKWSFVWFGGTCKSRGISEHDLGRVNAIDVTKFITIAYNNVQRLAHASTRSSEDTAAHHNWGLYAWWSPCNSDCWRITWEAAFCAAEENVAASYKPQITEESLWPKNKNEIVVKNKHIAALNTCDAFLSWLISFSGSPVWGYSLFFILLQLEFPVWDTQQVT